MSKSKKKSCPKLCVNCKYWDCYDANKLSKYGEVAEGECHRYPANVPCVESVTDCGITVPELTKMTPLLTHPFTFAADWCGEFNPMDEPRWIDE